MKKETHDVRTSNLSEIEWFESESSPVFTEGGELESEDVSNGLKALTGTG